MSGETVKNLRLGIFVTVGTLLFVATLYIIGLRKNVFGPTLKITAKFKNVNGLMEGNNVRFGGVDVGTIDQVIIASDSDIRVDMRINHRAQQHLRKNYIAAIGTDGLMGNRLVNIVASEGTAPIISNGDILESINPMETEEMLRAFNATGKNMKTITDNLSAITSKLKENNSVWDLLGSKVIAGNIESAITNFKNTGKNAEAFSRNIEQLSESISSKNNLLSVLTEPSHKQTAENILRNLENSSTQITLLTENMGEISRKINSGKGPAAALLNDSVLTKKISESISNLKESSVKLDENLEALQHSVFLRSFFKEKEKKKTRK
jgi:phospholipid/cholesterol/gamma-HCH transport system substrate-binding protein